MPLWVRARVRVAVHLLLRALRVVVVRRVLALRQVAEAGPAQERLVREVVHCGRACSLASRRYLT